MIGGLLAAGVPWEAVMDLTVPEAQTVADAIQAATPQVGG